jgi:hypothetical protein
MRVIGQDVSRTVAEVAYLEAGRIQPGGRVELVSPALQAFAKRLVPAFQSLPVAIAGVLGVSGLTILVLWVKWWRWIYRDRLIYALIRAGVRVRYGVRPMIRKQVCGAKTRRGTPCQCKKLYRGSRCRFHGGLSTGPKTAEGKSRALEALLAGNRAWRARMPAEETPT